MSENRPILPENVPGEPPARQKKKIVSVQDISCYGQCSLTVALPILSSRGIETAILPSAVLSTHTGGFSGFTCLDLTEEMPRILAHWMQEGIRFDAVYTGYIGDVRQFSLISGAAKEILKPGGWLIVDPAMADNGRLYSALSQEIVAGMRDLVRQADVILPNLTEAALLLDVPYRETLSRAEVREVLQALCDMGPELTVLTGVSFEEGELGAVAHRKSTGETFEYFTRRMERHYHGTGDIFSSVVTADLLNGLDVTSALRDACEFVVHCIRCTLPDETHSYGVNFETVLAQERGL